MYSLSLLIAKRFSIGRKNSGMMISLISKISTFGIAIGVAVLIIGLSIMNGFERELNNRILAVIPHGEIELANNQLVNWRKLLSRIAYMPGIAAAAPYINFSGLVEHGAKLRAIQVKGIDPMQEEKLSILPYFIQNHAWSRFKEGQQQIIIGSGIAKFLGICQNEWLTIMIANRNNGQGNLLKPKYIRLQVIGILQLNGLLDHSLALVPLTDAQNYLGIADNVTGIALKMYNPFNAVKLISDISKAMNSYVHIRSWISTYGYMYRDIQMIRTIIYLAMILVISIACFNIISTLMMAVKDKSSDIAILRTLGIKDNLISMIFVWYGLRTGLLGSLSGIVFGILITLNLTRLFRILERITGYNFFSSDIYFIDFLPSELHCFDVAFVIIISITLSLLASWYPAIRASCNNPARVLSKQ